MYNQNIQNALRKLDKSSQRRKLKNSFVAATTGVAIFISVFAGGWLYYQSTPAVSMEQLSRMIVVASRTSNNDPIRLLGDVERYMGKKVQELSRSERANALSYLIKHIELDHNRQDLVSY